MLQSSTASYASAPCRDDDDDDMFEQESKSAASNLGDDSTMFADEDRFRQLEQPAIAVSRPSSLNTASLPTSKFPKYQTCSSYPSFHLLVHCVSFDDVPR